MEERHNSLFTTEHVKWSNIQFEIVLVIFQDNQLIRGPPFKLQGGGAGGAGVFVADKLFISTRLFGALKMLLHVYIEQF